MNLFLVFIVAVSLPRLRVTVRSIDTKGYLDRDHTTAVNGLFILIVFASHVRSYIEYQPAYDSWLIAVVNWLGQLMVALFLFYSGYGIGESIKNKPGYVRTIPARRILPTLINFGAAILAYLGVNLALGNELSPSRVLLAFIGWTSIGNSNWYIFAILSMWLLTYVAFRVFARRPLAAVIATFVLAIGFTIFMYLTKGPQAAYSFNTVLAYPAGLAYSYFKPQIEKLYENNVRYVATLASAVAVFAVISPFTGAHYMIYELYAIAFCLVVVILTLKVQLRSPILRWFGQNLFWIYVLQRLPMMVMRHFGLNESDPYLFVVLSFLITLVLTVVFSRLIEPLSARVSQAVATSRKNA